MLHYGTTTSLVIVMFFKKLKTSHIRIHAPPTPLESLDQQRVNIAV